MSTSVVICHNSVQLSGFVISRIWQKSDIQERIYVSYRI